MKVNNCILGNPKSPVLYSGGGSILSIAPSGDGRYAATCAPTLCSHQGSALIFDPTGEIYSATANERERVGNRIIKLDPWGLVPDGRFDSLNPIDILDGLGMSLSDAARFMADFVVPYHIYQPRRMELEANDPFWPNMQRRLLMGLIILAVSDGKSNQRVLSRVREMLNGDDVVYNLAVKLDKAKAGQPPVSTMNEEARAELASFLQLGDQTRSGIIAGTNQHFGAFGNVIAQRATNTTSFDVGTWIRGENVSIYIVGPPSGITAFDTIYRLWLGCLMTPLLQRPSSTEFKTLVVLDINEAFELWPGLCTAITQKRSCQVWVVAADVSDVKWAFREFHQAVLNSFSVIQALKPRNYGAAATIAELFGKTSEELMRMSMNEVAVMVDGETPQFIERHDCPQDGSRKASKTKKRRN